MNWIIAVFAVASLICWSAVVRYDIQMFQQNSYRYSRYWTWLKKGNLLRHNRWVFLILPFLLWIPYMIWCISLFMIFYAVWEFRTRYKIRIAYTARVKRLLAADFILTASLNVLVYV